MLRIASYNTQCQLYSFRPAGCTPLSPSFSLPLPAVCRWSTSFPFLLRIRVSFPAFFLSIEAYPTSRSHALGISGRLLHFSFLLFRLLPPFCCVRSRRERAGAWKEGSVCTDVCIRDVYSEEIWRTDREARSKRLDLRQIFLFSFFDLVLNIE